MADDTQMEFVVPVKGALLDEYLAKGWYRMGAYIFTTHTLRPDDGKVYPVFWLRYNVANVRMGKRSTDIIKACAGFSARFCPFQLTGELEELYARYHASINFTASGTLENVLYDVTRTVYDSYLIEIRDGNKLIAAGVFDRGRHAIAGIVNFFDPVYKKFSLGKLLVLLKYQYCIHNRIPIYYPGYYSPEYAKFDYKLFLDKNATEVYLPLANQWVAYHEFALSYAASREKV
jgi:arginyl-tRNA--protein-N-Asp/Glu arginylyltransferase